MELQPLIESVALPMTSIPPLFAVPLDGRLYVAGLDVSGDDTRLAAVDHQGHATPLASLPIAVTGMAACDGSLIVAGLSTDADVAGAVALAVDSRGRTLWRAPLRGAARPQLAGVQGRPFAAWDAQDEIVVTPIAPPGGVAPLPTRIRLEDATYALSVCGMGERLLALRLHGPELGLELLLFAEGRLLRRVPVGEPGVKNAALEATPERARVAWLTATGDMRWQSFDVSLTPGASGRLHTEGARVTSMGWIADGERVALRLRRLTGEYEVTGRGESREPVAGENEAVMLPDGSSMHPLVPPGTRLRAGAWMDDRLFVLHGADGTPFVSVYRLRG